MKVDTAGEVKLMVFNMAGEQVVKILDQAENPGNYRASWDGRNRDGAMVGNGLYLVVIVQPSGKFIQKVIVLK